MRSAISPISVSTGSAAVSSRAPSCAASAPCATSDAAWAIVIQKRTIVGSVSVSGTPARAWRSHSSVALPALPSTFTSRTAARPPSERSAASAVSVSISRFVRP